MEVKFILLSKHDTKEEIEEKIEDYFDAGTQIVWYISPRRKQIYIYTSPINVKILRGASICSAAPILPDFSFKVEDMFA